MTTFDEMKNLHTTLILFHTHLVKIFCQLMMIASNNPRTVRTPELVTNQELIKFQIVIVCNFKKYIPKN